jgi:predicted enzyme related to lactoylglutathione lyase
MDRAIDFYRVMLGLEPYQNDPDGSARYRVGDTMLMVYPSEYAGTNKATAAGFEVEDLDSVVAELRSRGIEFQEFDYGEMKTVDGILAMPDGSRGAWFNDTEGNIIGVFQDA